MITRILASFAMSHKAIGPVWLGVVFSESWRGWPGTMANSWSSGMAYSYPNDITNTLRSGSWKASAEEFTDENNT